VSMLIAWCAVAVIVAGLISLAMRGRPDDRPEPAGSPALPDLLPDAGRSTWRRSAGPLPRPAPDTTSTYRLFGRRSQLRPPPVDGADGHLTSLGWPSAEQVPSDAHGSVDLERDDQLRLKRHPGPHGGPRRRGVRLSSSDSPVRCVDLPDTAGTRRYRWS
jgi:hypothetical protein